MLLKQKAHPNKKNKRFVFKLYHSIKAKRGFTLMELLVVISIIALLASIMIVVLAGTRKRARDTKRLAEMQQLILALEIYYDNHGQYPPASFPISGADPNCGVVASIVPGGASAWELGNKADPGAPNFLQELITDGIMSTVPLENFLVPSAANPFNCSFKYWRGNLAQIYPNCGLVGYKDVAILYTQLENPRPIEGAKPVCMSGAFEASTFQIGGGFGDPNGYMLVLREN